MNQVLRAQKSLAESCVISNVSELDHLLDEGKLRVCDMPTEIIMCRPDHFQIPNKMHEINVHMINQAGKVNRVEALRQWVRLYETLKGLCDVYVVDAAERLHDMVFAANAGSAYVVDGKRVFILSNMLELTRQGEPRHYKRHLYRYGYDVMTLVSDLPFEGQGDMLPHPHAGVMYGGYGFRTRKEVYTEISALLGVPVILLELVRPEFYHLDTAFCPLDNETVLYYPEAFSLESREMIKKMFPRRIIVTHEEAMTFVCNAVVVGRNVVLPRGADRVGLILEEMGFVVHWVDMDQFLLSGGAAKCLTLHHYRR
ncbi:amidinotransferase [Candidatus Kaiserbacteria bacterium]|nr:amidinotransferase [Candidatus Kaiserbacteria bacterium]